MTLATELRRAMTERGVKPRDVYETLGIQREHFYRISKGTAYPSHELAVRLADLLVCDRLVQVSLARSRRECVNCGKEFFANHSRRRHCTRQCAYSWSERNRRPRNAPRDLSRKLRTDALETRLRMHYEAVSAYCRGCSPEGLCVEPACDLRPVSPLPLARVRAA